MREIKFRGLRTDGKGWVYGMPVFPDDHNATMYMSEKPSGLMFKTKIETTGQYTGLKDKNGTEIYEGDICYDDHMNVRGKVVYAEGMFLYEWENIANTLFEVTKDIEVIGNIYENPKLLEVTE